MRRRLSITALCAAACAGPLIGGALPASVPLAALIALLGKALLIDSRQGSLPSLPLALLNLAFWLYFGWAALLGGIEASPFEVSLAFGTLFLLIRSLGPPSHYNDFLVLLASLCVLLASVDAAPAWLPLPITGLYLLAAAFALLARRGAAPAAREGVTVRRLTPAGAWRIVAPALLAGLSLSGLLAGTLLYLFVPRLDRSADDDAIPPEAESLAAGRAGRRGTDREVAVSGIPTTVRLGDIGRMKLDERVAFLAELRIDGIPHDAAPHEQTLLLLRARAWHDYDAEEGLWRHPAAARSRLPSGIVDPGGDPTVDWNISMRAYEGTLLFLPQRAVRIRAPGDALLVDAYGVVTSQLELRQYAVEAALPPVGAGSLKSLRPNRSDPRLLAVPSALRAALQQRLGERGPAASVADAIELVRRHFDSRRFRYTLTLPAAIGEAEDPLLAFLDQREGHCELFASAGCLMLRTLGIPARLVGGLRLGERLSEGLYQARFRNAHAWVEVACEGVGMVAVDFTPPDSGAQQPLESRRTETAAALRRSEERGARGGSGRSLDWRRPFAYGRAEQRALARRLVELSTALPWSRVAAVGAALLLLSLLPRLLRRRPPGPLTIRPPAGVPRRALAFYARWLKACARRGHRRRSHETPREFLASLPPELHGPGVAITAEFERLRYGGDVRLPA